ncbi:hypothetical protein B0H11DRAFT_1722912 [Mycena galericulata]|nr:hypothetical protein B0H11DRAFT_1753902 [Mycena galericulata]KAJ7439884.1 hypothetical protein B0H11DRAFT_1751347 [Mycena galericulata]KAJ7484051.1 hypothetical protein B0H11DRAFT_1722912 [Mycena galericulata]
MLDGAHLGPDNVTSPATSGGGGAAETLPLPTLPPPPQITNGAGDAASTLSQPPPPPPPPQITNGAGGAAGTGNDAPACPEDAPPWLRSALAQVSRQDVGPQYKRLLEVYLAVEKGYDYASSGKLSPKWRPGQVTEWIRDGRGRTKSVLAIANVDVFEKQWWEWWGNMQPEWRLRDAKGRPVISEEYGEDWGGLVAPGQNGLLSVVAALYWWACAEKSDGWEAAVADTIWVMRGLIEASTAD